MEKPTLKFIKGKCSPGSPADIYFYTDVDDWSVETFLWEFDYLVNNICPSKIRVHINSVGGSCIDGMSVFAKILDCSIPTECINDALAASMGSIIWAAGDELYMKDYALLMIHNPFCDCGGEKEYNQATEAFKHQLKTIYMKRFDLTEDQVNAIMTGKEGEDGTFLTADQAVEKGFVKAEHIIATPKAVKDRINAAINDRKDIAQLKAVYGLVSSAPITSTINEQNIKSKTNNNQIKMEKNEVTVFAALLGLTGEKANSENVTNEINGLKAKAEKADALQKSLDETKAELNKVNAELTGAQTSVKNLQEDLDKTKEALKVYEEAEAKAKEEKVNALIDQAVSDCKINKDERDIYLRMAQNDFELAEQVLSKIPARDNLGNIISKANEQKTADGIKSEQEKMLEKVNEVVGNDFQFRTL